jgi:Coenzyme PQQ synthesis protein D (PqqD)
VSDDGSSPRGETAADAPVDGPTGATVWRRSDRAAYVESEHRVVVLDLDHLDVQPYVFEGSAVQVWACLDGDRSESEIVEDLAEAYDVAPAVVQDGVREFIDRLRDLGLIVSGADG